MDSDTSGPGSKYMETCEPCPGCEGIGRWVMADKRTGFIRVVCVTCGRDMSVYPAEPDEEASQPAMYDGRPCPIPYPKASWEDTVNSLVCARREVDRLGGYIQEKLPREIGRGNFRTGESAVDIVIRILDRALALDGNPLMLNAEGEWDFGDAAPKEA